MRFGQLFVAFIVLVLAVGARAVGAQINPADTAASASAPAEAAAQDPNATPGDEGEAAAASPDPDRHLPSWQVVGETVTVVGAEPLREEELIGKYRQPRWTARRRFGETRVYVIPQGDVEFEYWLVPKLKRHGEPREIQQQFEVELGLPRRFQLDLYLVTNKTGSSGELDLEETKLEVRYALADWGKLWGNPTLYAEWKQVSEGADHVEGKLLLGGELRPRLHWGANLVFEHEMGGEQTNAYELTLGVSHTVRDDVFSVGAEVKLAWEDVEESRGDFSEERLIGPSIQFRPLPQMHVDLAALAGIGDESPRAKGIFIVGWEF
ncbi:MAG TPA: hypothetical protein VFS60_14345 [Thermoanaerobaculia bacterium]|nr:hypothetical protein [Thermoanaerobaculia bacterium]